MLAASEDWAMRFRACVVTYCLLPVEHFVELVAVAVWRATSQASDSSGDEVTSAVAGSSEARVEETEPDTVDCLCVSVWQVFVLN